MKNIIYEFLCKEQQEVIKSLKNQIKSKNEAVLRESRRANEIFRLSYDRKLKLQEQQAEINQLKEALKSVKQQTINLGDYEELGAIATISDICDKSLNGESEMK